MQFWLLDACFIVALALNYIAIAVLDECSYNGEKRETLLDTTLIHFLFFRYCFFPAFQIEPC